jgi:hypothetical protein
VPVRRHGAADLEVFLREGFVTLEAFRSVHVTPGGAEQRFQTLVARRG